MIVTILLASTAFFAASSGYMAYIHETNGPDKRWLDNYLTLERALQKFNDQELVLLLAGVRREAAQRMIRLETFQKEFKESENV